MLVSPRYTDGKLLSGDINDLIDVYEDRVQGWTINPAKTLLADPDSWFAVMSIVLAYFEGHAIFCKGESSEGGPGIKGKSRAFFVDAFCEVFPTCKPGAEFADVLMPSDYMRQTAHMVYSLGRCGLFHRGMLKHGIALGEVTDPILVATFATVTTTAEGAKSSEVKVKGAIINPRLFVESIEIHLRNYVKAVRNPANRNFRENLVKGWNATRPVELVQFPPIPG